MSTIIKLKGIENPDVEIASYPECWPELEQLIRSRRRALPSTFTAKEK